MIIERFNIFLVGLLSISLSVLSIAELSSEKSREALYESAKKARISEVNALLDVPTSEVLPFDKQEALAESFFASPEIPRLTSERLYRAGIESRDVDERAALFCRALSQLGYAIKKQPKDSRSLMTWANVRQILGLTDCKLPLTDGDFRQVTEYALKADPVSTRALFSAAEVALWSGDLENAYDRIRRFLTYATKIKESEREGIERLLLAGAPFDSIIPQRFPQVSRWSRRLKELDIRSFRREAGRIAKVQVGAIGALKKLREEGAVSPAQYFNLIFDAASLAASFEVRSAVDGELERYFKLLGNVPMERFFHDRLSLQELDVVVGSLASDTRPQRGALGSWGASENVVLDEFYQSVGFYVSENQSVRLVLLESAADVPPLTTSPLRVYGSPDNKSWEELRDGIEATPLKAGMQSFLAIRFDENHYRYIKLHYSTNNRKGGFLNTLPLLVRVFGYGDGGGDGK